MWYPLKNSIFSLSVASILLTALLAIAKPADYRAAAVAEPADQATLLQTVALLSDHLLIVDGAQKAEIAAALRNAAEALARQARPEFQASMSEGFGKRSTRRRTAMPFFSFGIALDRSPEPGA